MWLNEGEAYEKIPRMIPYLALPLGMGLLTIRFLQVAIKIVKGETDIIIASHEAEDLVIDAEDLVIDDGDHIQADNTAKHN
jgi:C4-dicarboxylate transporter DctQ subunit